MGTYLSTATASAERGRRPDHVADAGTRPPYRRVFDSSPDCAAPPAPAPVLAGQRSPGGTTPRARLRPSRQMRPAVEVARKRGYRESQSPGVLLSVLSICAR